MASTSASSRMNDVLPAALGVVVVATGWSMDLAIRDLPWSPYGVVMLHVNNPLHWLVDLFPFYLVWAHRLLRAQRFLRLERDALRRELHDAVAARARTRQFAGAVFDGLLVVDPDKVIVACNPAAEVMFGLRGEEMSGKPVDELILGLDMAAQHQRPRKTSRSELLAVEYQVQGQHVGGSRFPAVVTSAPFEVSSGTGTLYVIRDQGKQISSARTELRIDVDPSIFGDTPAPVAKKGLPRTEPEPLPDLDAPLPASVPPTQPSLDLVRVQETVQRLRGPLATLLGNIAHARGRLGEEAELQKVEASGHELYTELTNLAEVSALEAGTLDLHVESVPIESIVEEAVEAVEAITKASSNWVDTMLPDSGPTCEVDQQRARAILVNLLIRANRASKGSRIAVRARRERVDDRYEVVFGVQDPGLSMSEAHLEEARAFPTATSPLLGLQLAHAVARAMRGELTLESEPGEGTMALLRVPSKDKPTIVPAKSRRWQPIPRAPEDKRDRTALIIGATPAVAQVIRAALEAHHWKVDEELPDNALHKVRDDRPNLLVFGLDADPRKTWVVWLELKRHPILGLIPAMCIDDGTYARKTWQTRLVTTPVDAEAIAALAGHLHAARIVPRALLVESDAERAHQIARQLRTAGWWVHAPRTSQMALELAADLPPELIVLGGLPEGSLEEALAGIRGAPATRDVPVILAPGRELSSDESDRAVGASCVVVEPSEPDDMIVVHATIALNAREDAEPS